MEFRTRPSFQEIANKPNQQINYVMMKGDKKNFGFKKVTNKILNQSLSELMKLHEYFEAKTQHSQRARDINEINRLKNQNLYAHEYERIKNYLDTTVVGPVETKRLKERKEAIKAMGQREKTKYDELLNGK